MDERLIRNEVLCFLARENQKFIPAAVSGRHVHLSVAHTEALFGKEYSFTVLKELSQPGQFACKETVEVLGPKGSIGNVRILGPSRGETQVEISVTDSFVLGVEPAVRCSGYLLDTPGCVIRGPEGEVKIERGVIVSLRHVHMSALQAEAYGIKNNEFISLRTIGMRGGVLDMVLVRVGSGHDLELHIDTDEANAAMIRSGDLLEIVQHG